MIKVALANTGNLPDPIETLALLDRFSAERRDKIVRLSEPYLRKERFGSELLLAFVLAGYGKTTDEIFYGEYGKPLLRDLYFNVSHSGGKVAVAVSDCPIGCDLEKIRPYPQRVEQKKLTPREREFLAGCADRDSEFFRIWTAKESYLKMTGEGITALSSVEIIYPRVYRDGACQECTLSEATVGDFVLTMCGTGELTQTQTIDLNSLL